MSIDTSSTETLVGTVTSGFQRGQEFVSLEGYSEQFQEKLDYQPYPGTLNIETDENCQRILDEQDPITIDPWVDGETTYGAVDCYPATLSSGSDSIAVHLLVPRRTDHDASTLEFIAPISLREALQIEDGSSVQVGLPEN